MAATSELLAKLTSIDAVDDPRGRQLRLLRVLAVAVLPFVLCIGAAASIGLVALFGVVPGLGWAWWLMSKAAETPGKSARAPRERTPARRRREITRTT